MHKPLAVFAKTVVHDTPTEIAEFVQPGSPAKVRSAVLGGTAHQDHRPVVALREGWVDKTWARWRLLTFKRPRDAHSISLAWHDDTGQFAHWYIDLTSPLRRRVFGFDLVENGLDVVVEPDMSSWQFKRCGRLEWGSRPRDLHTGRGGCFVRRRPPHCERLIRERSYFERWTDWRPDPTWPQATLRVGWDVA